MRKDQLNGDLVRIGYYSWNKCVCCFFQRPNDSKTVRALSIYIIPSNQLHPFRFVLKTRFLIHIWIIFMAYIWCYTRGVFCKGPVAAGKCDCTTLTSRHQCVGRYSSKMDRFMSPPSMFVGIGCLTLYTTTYGHKPPPRGAPPLISGGFKRGVMFIHSENGHCA